MRRRYTFPAVKGTAHTSPDMASALVKDASHRMLVTLEKRRAEVDRDSTLIYKMVQEILVPHFDFERITQGALGRGQRLAPAGRYAGRT